LGDTGLFSVIGYDADDYENWTWMPIWTWDGFGLGPLVSIDLYNYSITFNATGFDTVNVSVSGIPSIYNVTQVTTTALPTVDYIVIKDAPGGAGNIIGPQNLSVGQSLTLYAAGYNLSSGYVVDIDVTWSSSDASNATVVAGPGMSTTLTANNTHGGTFIITATNASLPIITNSTETLTVLSPTVDDIQIRDAPANVGNVVQGRSYSEGQTDTFYAAGFNNTAGYIGDVAVSWESTNTAAGTVSPAIASSTIFTAGIFSGTTTVTAIYSPGISNDTGTLTVSAPPPPLTIDNIIIRNSPGGLGSEITQISLVAGAQITVYAAGYNTSTGEFIDNVSVTWSVVGGVGTLDTTTGTSTTFTALDTTGSQVTGTLEADYSGITATADVIVELSPLAPIGLTVSQIPSGESLRITWGANVEGDIDGYVIFRSTTSDGNFTELDTVTGVSNTQYTDTGLTDGTTYYYYIMAFDVNQNFSPPSTVASGVSDRDTDGDGTYDLQDNDDDGDGLSDTEEAELGTDPLDEDTDGDGRDDLEDKYPLDPDRWRDEEEEGFPIALILIPVIVIIVLILLFFLMKKRKKEEEMPPEEEEVEGMPDEEESDELPEEDLDELSDEGYFEDEEEPSLEDEEEPSLDDEDFLEDESELGEDEDLSEGEEEISEAGDEAETEDKSSLEDLADEFECPDCGTPLSGSITKCPNCGLEFEEED